MPRGDRNGCGGCLGLRDICRAYQDAQHPHPDNLLHLQDGVYITENDVAEAGKAIGAIRAGYLTLMREVNLWVEDVPTSFMSGASGLLC